MARIWLPKETDLARAARGWPAPKKNPTVPVKINWSHPLTEGLEAFMLPVNGVVVDLVTGRVASVTGAPTIIGSEYGATSDIDSKSSNDGYILQDIAAGWSGTDCCVEWKLNINAYDIFGSIPLYFNDGTARYFQIYPDGMRQGFHGNNIINHSFVDYESWQHVFFNSVGRSDNSAGLYANGVEKTTSSYSLSTHSISSGAKDIYFGRYPLGVNWELDGKLQFIRLWSKGVDAEKIRALNNDPFLILEPANQSPFLIQTAAAAAPTSPYWLPSQNPVALAARGRPGPKVKPTGQFKLNRNHPLAKHLLVAHVGGDFPPINYAADNPRPYADLTYNSDNAFLYRKGYVNTGGDDRPIWTSDVPKGINGATALSFVASVDRATRGGFTIHQYPSTTNRSGLLIYENSVLAFIEGSGPSRALYTGYSTCGMAWDANKDGGKTDLWVKSASDDHYEESTSARTSAINSSHNRLFLLGYGYGAFAQARHGATDWAYIFDKKITSAEFDAIEADPFNPFGIPLYVPINDTPFLIGAAAEGGPTTITGTGALSAQTAAIAGTGTAVATITGTGDLDAQTSALAGTGVVSGTVTGTGDLDAQTSAISGVGEIEHTGTGDLDAQSSQVAGVGKLEHVGTGDLDAQAATVAGTGETTAAGVVTGTGAITAQSSAIGATVVLERVASGALAATASSIDATGILEHVGTGALAAQVASVAGVGNIPSELTGTGAMASQASQVDGTGAVTGPDGWTPITPTSTVWTETTDASTTWTDL